MTKFGKALRKIREKKELYLKNVADVMGWSVVYLSDIERGNRNPPAKNDIIKLSKFLGIDIDYLLNLADKDKGFVEVNLKGMKKKQSDTALSIARKMETFGDEDWEELNDFLKKRGL